MIGSPAVRCSCWKGDGNKGLGVISYGDYSFTIDARYDPSIKWILPLHVDGPCTFTLLAIWTLPDPLTKFYITPLRSAYERYRELFEAGRVVLAGDFNQSVLFDKTGSASTFGRFIQQLAAHQLTSMYHLSRCCEHGNESEPTLYWQHNESKPYHIDYIFATPDLHGNEAVVNVGQYADWVKLSDHMPLTCDFPL